MNEPPKNKPTPEELQASIDEAIEMGEDAEKNPKPEEEEEEENPAETPESEEEPAPKPEAKPDEEEAEEEEEQAEPSEEEKEAIKKKLEDEKKKSSASARENQRILAKNRTMNQALVEADDLPEPTEEELIKEYPEWDVMSEVERGLAKETVISRNWRKTISKAKEQSAKIEKWNESVDEYVEDPKTLIDTPELEGKTEAFRAFAAQPENNSVPFKVLVGAFLHEQAGKAVKHKGKMFENGSGGPNEKPIKKSNKISLEESRRLRETDYPKWKEYIDKDMIDYTV